MPQRQAEKMHARLAVEACVHGNVADMNKSPRSVLVAQQLRALMARHGFTKAPQLARHAKEEAGIELDYVTINRLLAATAKTEPKAATLRDIARAVGEDYDTAFPDKPQRIVEIAGQRFALKALESASFTPAVLKKLAELGVGPAEEIHEIKKSIRKKGE